MYVYPASLFLFVFFVGNVPIKRDANSDGAIRNAFRLYRFADGFPELFVFGANLFLHLFLVGNMPIKRHANSDGAIRVSDRLFGRNSSNVADVHVFRGRGFDNLRLHL